MGELVHASRHGSLVYDRTFPDPDLPPGALPGLSAVRTLFDLFSGARYRGHTRLHSASDPGVTPASSPAYYEQMEQPGYTTARYPAGNSIGANFYLHIPAVPSFLAHPLGVDRKELGSVTSTGGATRGWACTWDPDHPYRTFPTGILTLYVPRFHCDLHRGMHPWWGITPYMHFDATGEGCDSAEREYCQPDVWVILRSGADEGAIEREAAILRAAGSADPFPEKRKLAVARALAYYHRPGSWREPPNFFNPHWKAKLAPAEEGWRRLGREVGGLAEALAPIVGEERELR
jgi:hypothetical protein